MTFLDEIGVRLNDAVYDGLRGSGLLRKVADLNDVGRTNGIGSQPLANLLQPLFSRERGQVDALWG